MQMSFTDTVSDSLCRNSHPTLTDFPKPLNSKTAHFRVAYIVASLRHTCAIIMLSNQHLDMPQL